MNLVIDLTEDQRQRLEAVARPLGVSVEELARAALVDLLSRPEPEFEAAVDEALKKNVELYRRLA